MEVLSEEVTFKLRHKGWEYKVIKHEKRKRNSSKTGPSGKNRRLPEIMLEAWLYNAGSTGYRKKPWFLSESRWKPKTSLTALLFFLML